MHGRKRNLRGPTAEEVRLQREKAAKYGKLMSYVREARRGGDKSEETLKIVAKLLLINGDAYTLWNYRKEILVDDFDASVELSLTAQCLEKNPKCYGAWYHRKWVLARRPELASAELGLCSIFLEADERNFHCWNHRRFASELAKESNKEVIAFCLEKLDANFSNYSALHELTHRFPSFTKDQAQVHLDLVAQAIFTEPDDQSAWWYQETLVRKLKNDDEEIRPLIDAHLEALAQLRDLEPTCKWPLVALIRFKKLLYTDNKEEVNELREALIKLDPAHEAMYKYTE